MIAQPPSRSAEVFAAFRPIDLAEALTQRDLTPSASDLFLYLHTIAPFGNFYSWNDAVNQQSIREALKRRTGKHRGKPMDIRTYQRSRKQLVASGLVAVSKRGFRILELACRRPNQQADPQLNVFSWAKTRQSDRDRPLEPASEASFGDRKDPDLDLSRSKTSFKQKHPPTHLFVPKKKEEEEFGTKVILPSQERSSKTQLADRKTLQRSRISKTKTYTPSPAFTKLQEKYLPELEAVAIPKERIYSSLVAEIKLHSWEEFCTAIAYTKQRQARAELPPLVSPAAYLMAAMQRRYQPQTLQVKDDLVITAEQEWLDLAYNKLRLCYSMRRPDGELSIMFLDASGNPQPPVALAIAQQQYPLEHLRAMVEGQRSAVSGQEGRKKRSPILYPLPPSLLPLPPICQKRLYLLRAKPRS